MNLQNKDLKYYWKNYIEIVIYLYLCWEKKYKIYYSIERYHIFHILEVRLHIINVLVSHSISLISSSAIHIATIYFYTNLLKATKQTTLT